MQTLRAAKAEHRPLSTHRVVLIPGFLGFNMLGDFSYFASKVGSALADALADADQGRLIEVDAVETVPAGSLHRRQQTLVEQLQAICERHPGAQLHLVGHSTGGLDAELLARTPRTGQERSADVDEVRRAVRSVITLASPLAGTSLALSPLAQITAIDSVGDFLRAPLSLLLLRGPRALFGALGALLRLVGRDESVGQLISGALHSGNAGVTYLLSLLLSRDLIEDLSPRRVTDVMMDTAEDPGLPAIRRSRFVTIARRVAKPSAASMLFGILYDATAREAPKGDDSEALARQQLAARLPRLSVIGSGGLPELVREANDGIVDTCRQVTPVTAATVAQEVGRVAAIVIADHIDVIGYYRGANGNDSGFLTSGSNFRDAEFRALYAAIAREVVASIRAVSQAAPGVPAPVSQAQGRRQIPCSWTWPWDEWAF